MLRQRMFWLFTITGFAELTALLAIGESTISRASIIVLCALVVWLGSGSRTAWWIFVVGNALALSLTLPLAFATTSGNSGGGTLWGDVIATGLGSVALLAMPLSPPMRRHHRAQPVGARPGPGSA
jgi:hypothetical protein